MPNGPRARGRPVLEPYELGLFTLKRHLHNPLVDAFWSLLPDEVDQ